jgi:hypothetical protein
MGKGWNTAANALHLAALPSAVDFFHSVCHALRNCLSLRRMRRFAKKSSKVEEISFAGRKWKTSPGHRRG